jgi:hypothetical protein
LLQPPPLGLFAPVVPAAERYKAAVMYHETMAEPGPGSKATTHARAALYVRISSDRGGAGLGVARQEEDCRALCARLGWRPVEVYADNDV